MKVAIVLNTSWNIYNFRMGMVQSLINEGVEVYAIAPRDDYSELLEEAGCKYVEVKMDSRGANPFKDSMLILELRKIYKDIRPDLIFHFTIKPNIYGTLAATSLNIPVVNNVCGLGTVFLKEGIVSKVAVAMYRLAFKYPKKIFFQNKDDKALFIERQLVDQTKVDLLPGSGINTSHFQPQERQQKDFTFLVISRLIHDKGILEYVNAIKKLKQQGINARFQLLGPKDPAHKRGIDLATIDNWINSGTVEYMGTTDDVRTFIKEADCVILPSYREGTPRTLLEAASMGKPLIATNVPGCTNVVDDQFNGLLCNLKDADDLADKMQTMYELSEAQRQTMGQRSREKVSKEFDERIVIDKYLNCIQEIQHKPVVSHA